MSRFAVSGRSTIVGSATLPQFSLYAAANVHPHVREVAVFNTTVSGFVVALMRLSSAGTQGTAKTEVPEGDPLQASLAQAFNGHTVAPTLNGELRRATIGAALGSGIIWTFGDRGLKIDSGTANGIGVIVPSGTGQISDWYISWDE
jgi:hypothetical protein